MPTTAPRDPLEVIALDQVVRRERRKQRARSQGAGG
jgi:hypothetical protein